MHDDETTAVLLSSMTKVEGSEGCVRCAYTTLLWRFVRRGVGVRACIYNIRVLLLLLLLCSSVFRSLSEMTLVLFFFFVPDGWGPTSQAGVAQPRAPSRSPLLLC